MDMNQLTQQAESEPASEQEEQQYQQALDFSLESLNSGPVAANTAKRVDNAETPEKGVAEAVFVLVRRAEEQLGGLEDSVKLQLAEDLMLEVLGLMIDSGRLDEEAVNDEMVEKITVEMYTMYAQDAEQRGVLDTSKVEEDVREGEQMQGVNAMSNNAVQRGGLMNV